MCEESHTAGRVVASREERRMMGSMSMEFNKKTAMFRKLFPELIEEYDEQVLREERERLEREKREKAMERERLRAAEQRRIAAGDGATNMNHQQYPTQLHQQHHGGRQDNNECSTL